MSSLSLAQPENFEDEIRVISDRVSVMDLKKYENPDSVVWLVPKKGQIVKGTTYDGVIGRPSEAQSDIILNLKPHFQAKKAYLEGHKSWDSYVTEGWHQEYKDAAYQLYSFIDQGQHINQNTLEAAAAVIRPEHFAPLISTAINEVIVAIDNEEHNLLQTVQNVEMDKLNARFILDIKDNGHKMVSRNIGEEGLPSQIGPYPFSAKSIDLQLNGTKITFAGTFQITAMDFDVLSPFQNITEGALTRDKQYMVAEFLNDSTITETPLTDDWDAIDSNGRPTVRAYRSLSPLFKLVSDAKKGQAQWIASNLDIYESFVENSGLLGTTVTAPYDNTGVAEEPKANFIDANPPRMRGRKWVVDDLIDADTLVTYNSRAIYFAQGPRRSSTMNDPVTGNFGNINLEYYKAHLVYPELIKRMTSILT